MDIHEQRELVDAAFKALTRPPHFLNFGNPELFVTWGPVISQHRDSTAMGRSNFRVLVEYVEGLATNHHALDAVMTLPDTDGYRKFVRREDETDIGEAMETARSSHFLVGWIEELNVRILVDPKGPMKPWNITRLFAEIVAVLSQAEESGVIDEDDLAELEGEELHEAFCELVGQVHKGASDYSDMPDAIITDSDVLFRYAYDNGLFQSIDDLDSDVVTTAIAGLVEEWAHAEYAHTYRHQLPLF